MGPRGPHLISVEAYMDSPAIDQLEFLLTRAQTAAYLGCSVSKIDSLATAGRITRIRIGRSVRFDFAEVQAFAESCREGD